MDSPPHHGVLLTLLEGNQFEACRISAESLIEQEFQKPAPADEELARLYLVLSQALVGLEQFQKAAETADYAWCLARKAKQVPLMAEARFQAGRAYVMGQQYRIAIARLTDCLQCGESPFVGKALHNRGVAHRTLGEYELAAETFEGALEWATAHGAPWRETCWLELVWSLILSRNFEKAEGLLSAFEAAPSSERRLQLHVAHDRVHLALMKGEHREAVQKAVAALKETGMEYPHIRAYIALSLMGVATRSDQPDPGFALGLLAKRLAARGKRPDLDREAGQRLLDLQCKAGPDGLNAALLQMGQVGHGALARKGRRRKA